MVLVITQQTFDEAVQENINDLGLTPEEALSEAVNQFTAQGVDLTNILKKIGASDEFQELSKIIEQLQNEPTNLNELLASLKQECDKGIQFRVYSGRAGVYTTLLNLYQKHDSSKIVILKVLISLMTKQPDLLEENGAKIIVENLSKNVDQEIQKYTLKLCKECCVMHEMNRQKFFNLKIIDNLVHLLSEQFLLSDILILLRALILDDDIRVEFGKAHEHARIIATEMLPQIIKLINTFQKDEILINELVLTLSSLLVRTEFCLKVEEQGGIELIKAVMSDFSQNEKITRQCFKVTKALAGNDDCKIHIIQKGLAPIISNCLSHHKGIVPTAVAGLNCIAALSLRCPDNSKALFEADIPDVIIEVMKKHPNEKSIQKTASWAIRNMVSRSRYQNSHFLELGVEDLLLQNLGRFKEFEYDTKAALRDLECEVALKEEWTGKGGKISSETLLKNINF